MFRISLLTLAILLNSTAFWSAQAKIPKGVPLPPVASAQISLTEGCASTTKPNLFKVSSDSGLSKILMSARIVPEKAKNGKTYFRVEDLDADSPLRAVDIREKDLLIKINDQTLDQPYRLMELYSAVSSKEAFCLVLLRGSKELQRRFQLRD